MKINSIQWSGNEQFTGHVAILASCDNYVNWEKLQVKGSQALFENTSWCQNNKAVIKHSQYVAHNIL